MNAYDSHYGEQTLVALDGAPADIRADAMAAALNAAHEAGQRYACDRWREHCAKVEARCVLKGVPTE